MGKKSKNRAKQRFDKGLKRNLPEDVLQEGRWTRLNSQENTNASATDNLLMSFMDKLTIAKGWKQQCDAILKENDKITIPDQCAHNHHKIIELTTNLLDDIQSTFEELGLTSNLADESSDKKKTGHEFQSFALHMRSLAFLNLAMHDECIKDCTEGLLLSECNLGTNRGFREVAFLMKRGASLVSLRQPDEAVADFEAACAAFRLAEESPWDGWPTFDAAKKGLLEAKALQKIHLPRPHYSREERELILKELQLGCFAKDKLNKCQQCGQSANFSMCSRCNNAWFCSQECLTIAWENGRKKCKKPMVHVLVENKTKALEEIAQVGYLTNGNL